MQKQPREWLICGLLLQICWDVKACPGAPRAERVVGDASEILDTFPVLLQVLMGVAGGEGSNEAGSRIFWGEGQGCGLEGMSTLGRNSFCGSDCRFLPPHLATGTLSPPTSFLKQQKAVFLPGRSSLEPVPWRWKWQKKQDGERG